MENESPLDTGMRFRNAVLSVFDKVKIKEQVKGKEVIKEFLAIEYFDENFDKIRHICQYMCGQLEICPKSGAYHYQLYIEFDRQRRLKGIQDVFGYKVHLDERRGTQHQAIIYTQKSDSAVPDTWFEVGERRKQGLSDDLEADRLILEETNDISKCSFKGIVKHHEGYERYLQLREKDRTTEPKVIWCYGGTGLGKTYSIYKKYGFDNVYKKNTTNKWWDGYNQNIHKVIIIDELRFWHAGNSDLLDLLQGMPYTGETKGSTVKINSPLIYITSPYSPNDIWETSKKDKVDQLLRRISLIRYFYKTKSGEIYVDEYENNKKVSSFMLDDNDEEENEGSTELSLTLFKRLDINQRNNIMELIGDLLEQKELKKCFI